MRKFWMSIAVAATLSMVACGSSSSPTKSSTSSSSTSASVHQVKTVDHGVPASCTPAGSAQIEVTSPLATDTLIPGDTLVVRWRSLVANFTGYLPQVSLDNGSSYTTLVNGSVLADANGAAAQCFSINVVIDSSYIPGDTTNAKVIFRVKDYESSQATMRAAAPAITVLAK